MKKKYFLPAAICCSAFFARAQNVGIGTTAPVARLHVADSAVVFTNNATTLNPAANPPVQGAGIRMMWYPQKAAFRVGGVDDGTLIGFPGVYPASIQAWNKDSIGSFSFASGYNTKAKGFGSTAMGLLTTASGSYSTAMGYSSTASGFFSTAMGVSTASGNYSTAMGHGSFSGGGYSTAIGTSFAGGIYSTAMGISIAYGDYSTAMGLVTKAKAIGGTVVGLYNDSLDAPSRIIPADTDRLFQIGNGTTDSTRSNAMTVLRNGNMGIGTVNPVARLHVADSSVVFARNTTALNSNANPPVQGAGVRMMWYPEKAAFRVGAVDDGTLAGLPGFCATCPNNWNRDSIGNFSFATGVATKAKGNYSLAAGAFTNATGHNSTALGQQTTASGNLSTAMGFFTKASGTFSTATGTSTMAKAYGSFTAGVFNDTIDSPNPTTPTLTDRIFQIGNGTADNARSNAMTVLRNGNTGIGTVNPAARLHVADSAVVFTNNATTLNTAANPPVQGAGIRMMWYPAKAAFRAGYVDNTNWDRDNIGNFSFASGFDTKASGSNSTSMGVQTTASGFYSTAMGYLTTASGQNSIAMGGGTTASGLNSTAMGNVTTASGWVSTAMGDWTFAKALGSFTTGRYNDNTDNPDPTSPNATDRIFQIGNGANTISTVTRSNALTVLRNGNTGIGTVTPDFPLSFPNTLGDKISLWGNSGAHYGFGVQGSLLQIHSATTLDDIAFGYGSSGAFTERVKIINNGEFGMTVGGRMQLRTGTQSAGIWLTNSANTSNHGFMGMKTDTEVGFFGQTGTPGWRFYVNTTDGNAFLQGTLIQNSDMRLKKNIHPLSNTLSNINQLNGYSYNWKDESADPSLQIGLLAQEIQKVYPQLVKENEKGTLSVNYMGMVPVLLEAIKEQQQQIDELKKENSEIKTLIKTILKQ
jgi:Chaperone of endosialidase/Head domain of trimeric autotransporter adhesin